MSKEQLEHFRSILNSWKRDLMVEVDRTVSHMKDEAANFPDPNDRATQEEEFSLELRTRDRERKLIRKIDEALKRIEDGSLRLLPRDRRGNRHQAPRGAPGRHAQHRGAGAPRAPRAPVRRPRRPLPLSPPPLRRALRALPDRPAAPRLARRRRRAATSTPATAAGEWLVRIEDLDRDAGDSRCAARSCAPSRPSASPGTARSSTRASAPSTTTRRSRAWPAPGALSRAAAAAASTSAEARYPGTCRAGPRRAGPTATRFRVRDQEVSFRDRIQGECRFDLAERGDVVIRRRDGAFAYQLAVVVDDALQGVTDVVRGADLLDSTPWQIALQEALGLPAVATPTCRWSSSPRARSSQVPPLGAPGYAPGGRPAARGPRPSRSVPSG